MRLLDVIENHKLTERFETAFYVNYTKRYAEIYRNPTRKEIDSLLDANNLDESVRAFIAGNDILVWNTFTAMHRTVKEELGLNDHAIPIVIWFGGGSEVHVEITDATRHTPLYHSPEVGYEVRGHPWFSKHNLDVDISYFDEDIVGPWEKLDDELTEAPPVADIQTYDYTDGKRGGSISKHSPRDWALVSKPSMQERLKRTWKNSKYTYYIHVFDLDASGEKVFILQNRLDNLRGLLKSSDAHSFYRYFIQQITDFDMPDPVPGAITVLVFQNYSAEHPLTPWIIGHRIGHGLADGENNRLKANILNILEPFHIFQGITVLRPDLFTMKSARGHDIETDELVYEIIAQYVVKGKVIINRETSYDVDEDALEERMNSLLDSYFESLVVGNYLITY